MFFIVLLQRCKDMQAYCDGFNKWAFVFRLDCLNFQMFSCPHVHTVTDALENLQLGTFCIDKRVDSTGGLNFSTLHQSLSQFVVSTKTPSRFQTTDQETCLHVAAHGSKTWEMSTDQKNWHIELVSSLQCPWAAVFVGVFLCSNVFTF